jgi:hypothetical protein
MDDLEDEEEVAVKPMLNEKEKKKVKYEVQKNFQEFYETNTDNKKRMKKVEKLKDKVRNSEYYNDLKRQFSENPDEINPYGSKRDQYLKEMEDYEVDNFRRVKVSKKDLKFLGKKDREFDDFTRIEKDFKNFNRVLKEDEKKEFMDQMKFDSSKKALSGGFLNKKRSNGGKFNKSFKKHKTK